MQYKYYHCSVHFLPTVHCLQHRSCLLPLLRSLLLYFFLPFWAQRFPHVQYQYRPFVLASSPPTLLPIPNRSSPSILPFFYLLSSTFSHPPPSSSFPHQTVYFLNLFTTYNYSLLHTACKTPPSRSLDPSFKYFRISIQILYVLHPNKKNRNTTSSPASNQVVPATFAIPAPLHRWTALYMSTPTSCCLCFGIQGLTYYHYVMNLDSESPTKPIRTLLDLRLLPTNDCIRVWCLDM